MDGSQSARSVAVVYTDVVKYVIKFYDKHLINL